MKRKITFAIVSVLLGVCLGMMGCHSEKPSKGTTECDSISISRVETFTWDSINYSRKSGMLNFAVKGVYPISGPEHLVTSIQKWMNEMLGGSYQGEMSDTTALLRHYAHETFAEFDSETLSFLEDMGTETEHSIEFQCAYDTDSLLTMLFSIYSYSGGAHGGYMFCGTTFRKSDGHRYGWDIVREDASLSEEIKRGLKTYFEIRTDEELSDCLMLEASLDTPPDVNRIPLPQSSPWLEADGLHFVYQQYEIACYAAGLPTFVIPSDRMMRYIHL